MRGREENLPRRIRRGRRDPDGGCSRLARLHRQRRVIDTVTVSAPVSASLVTLFRHRLYVEEGGRGRNGDRQGAHHRRWSRRAANEPAARVPYFLRERGTRSVVGKRSSVEPLRPRPSTPPSGSREPQRLFLTSLGSNLLEGSE